MPPLDPLDEPLELEPLPVVELDALDEPAPLDPLVALDPLEPADALLVLLVAAPELEPTVAT